MNRTCSSIAALTLTVLIAARATARPAMGRKAPATAGCYALRWPSKQPFRRYAAVGFRPKLPESFELTRKAAPYGGGYVITTDNPTDYSFAAGWRVAGSNIELDWSGGFTGITVVVPRLPETGEVMGLAETYSDVPEPPQRVRVRLVRIPCRGEK